MPATATAAKSAAINSAWVFPLGIVVSAAAHFALFSWNPHMRAANLEFASTEMQMVDALPPDIEIPPPPEAIARPATPVVAASPVDERITIAPTTFEANPLDMLPPPPSATTRADQDISRTPQFTPYTVRPELKNPEEVRKLLETRYPVLLRNAGIGGTVLVWVFIDERGTVQRSLVKETSGYPALDETALGVTGEMHFTPALNRELRVPVWIEIPLIFTTR